MASDGLDAYVTVYCAHGRLDAETIRSFLEAQGITVFIDQDTLGLIYSFTVGDLGTVGIKVPPDQAERAASLLAAMVEGDFSNEVLVANEDTEIIPHIEPSDAEDEHLKERKKVLFLGTANEARSQMAEAIINNDCWDTWVAYSAGTQPSGTVHPLAKQIIDESDIFHQGRSKAVEEFQGQAFDLVVTLSSRANESCPLWLKQNELVHLGFDDPAAVEGNDEEKLAAFRKTFALIRAAIPPLLANDQH